MLEIEIYAAGVRDINKILMLDHELEAVHGLRYKVDSNHDIVYMEFDEPVLTMAEVKAVFRRIGLHPRVVGRVPEEMRLKAKTQRLDVT